MQSSVSPPSFVATTTTPMASNNVKPERTLADLLKELSLESRTLLRQEVELAKTEATEKITRLVKHVVVMVVGGVIALLAAALLLMAVERGLTVLLALAVGLKIAVWLSPLLLALLLAVGAYVLINMGIMAIKNDRPALTQTKQTLQENKQWMKEKIS